MPAFGGLAAMILATLLAIGAAAAQNPAPVAAGAPATIDRAVEGDAALGEYLSGECVTCHQLSGKNEGIPSIVGWPAPWFVEAMNAYKSKKRANPVMQTIAGRYTEDEIAALAVYFETIVKQPPR